MLAPNVADFLRKAQADPSLAEQVKNADTYQDLAALSEAVGEPAPPADLRAAFTARNAGVLTRHMMRRGLIDTVPLRPVPPMKEDLWERVATMDLSPVVQQLVDYRGWTAKRAAAAERRYRRFFYLKAAMPTNNAAPTTEVDEFWHEHIINTRRYGPDCEQVAGQFLHHTFVSPDEMTQTSELLSVWLSTCASYEELFEEPYEETIGAALLRRWPKA